eukprot:scaffold29529_cov36-Cyclotella_meneghiniana.AAC.1
MASSLQIAAQTLPNPTTTITNVYATGGGGGGVDSSATAVKITAEAAYKCTNEGSEGHFTSVGKDRGRRSPQKLTQRRNNQSGSGWGCVGLKRIQDNTTISRNNAGEMGENATIIVNCCGRCGCDPDTTTNRIQREQQ